MKKLQLVALGMVFTCLGSVAWAQSATQREKDLMNVIQALTERLEALESRIQDLERQEETAAPAPELEQRVEQIEEKIEERDAKSGDDFRVYYQEGLRFDSGNGAFKLKIGGRIQNDWAWFDQDSDLLAIGKVRDGTEFRRARFYMSGTLYENLAYMAEYDFQDGVADFKDVYIELKKIPVVGNLRVGHFKEPFGLEQLTSSKYFTFMERALPTAFDPERNTGAMIYNHMMNERITWAAGVFRETDAFGDSTASSMTATDGDGDYNGTIRVTGLPWYKDGGRKLLHLGGAYSHRSDMKDFRYRTRPEANLSGPRFVDTGEIDADSADVFGLEAALVYGPLSLQGEYKHARVHYRGLGEEDYDGYYVQASYFLTGENRAYKTATGAFDRVRPKNNFNIHGEERGWGAWEVAARYSSIDLDSGFITGGEEDNITLGLNWYLNPNTRVMFNYVHAEIDSYASGLPVDGDLNILQTRFQVDF